MGVFKNSSDESLIAQTLAGDDRAFGELVRRYAPIVLAWLSANNGNDGENEDLVQEALLNAYLRLAKLRHRDRFGPWLVAITRHKLMDARRNKSRQPRITTIEQGQGPYGDAVEALSRQDDTSRGPRERASSMETENIVHDAISNMGDTYREILHMRLFGEETPQAIAHRLGLRESTVRMRLLRGLKKLRKSTQLRKDIL